jgi:hypothetical protein
MVPNAKFIFILRHPVAVALATKKWAKITVCELLLHWYLAHQAMIRDSEKLRSFVILRYEDLVDKQENVLSEIFKVCNISEFTPERRMVDHNEKYFEQWRAECKATNELMATAFPDVLKFFQRFGYALEGELVREPIALAADHRTV